MYKKWIRKWTKIFITLVKQFQNYLFTLIRAPNTPRMTAVLSPRSSPSTVTKLRTKISKIKSTLPQEKVGANNSWKIQSHWRWAKRMDWYMDTPQITIVSCSLEIGSRLEKTVLNPQNLRYLHSLCHSHRTRNKKRRWPYL